MNIKRFIVGTVVGGIALFAIGNLFCWVIFAPFYGANPGTATNLLKDQQENWALVLGSLTYGGILTFAIETLSRSARIVDGLKIGAILGGLIWFTVDMQLYSFWNVSNLTSALVDPLIELLRGGISGSIIAAAMLLVGNARRVPQPH